jgi:hypothetical protein
MLAVMEVESFGRDMWRQGVYRIGQFGKFKGHRQVRSSFLSLASEPWPADLAGVALQRARSGFPQASVMKPLVYSDSESVNNARAEDVKNDRSTSEHSAVCRTLRLRQIIRLAVTRNLHRRVWRDFRCHVRRKALALARLV